MFQRLLIALGLGAAAYLSTRPAGTVSTATPSNWRQIPVGEHFTLGEFVRWGLNRGPHRAPPADVQAQIRDLVRRYLDPIRRALGPVQVLSGWRPSDLYPERGGRASAHTLGAAADIRVNGYTPAQLALTLDRMAANGEIPHGGLGVYPAGYDGRAQWDPTVHVDTRAHTNGKRRERWPDAWWRAQGVVNV